MSEQAKNPYGVAVVAEVLEAHACWWYAPYQIRCRCGWESMVDAENAHRAHVAEQVAALGGGA